MKLVKLLHCALYAVVKLLVWWEKREGRFAEVVYTEYEHPMVPGAI